MSLAAPTATARQAGLVACRRCGRVWALGAPRCGRCGAALVSRDPRSISRVWAWWLAGLMAYIPANLAPMLETRTLGQTSSDTIIGGALTLYEHGAVGISLVILTASVVIPITKFLAIAFLALSVMRGDATHPNARHRLHEVVEFIGRWSMVDVFVVAILSALVQLGAVASVTPGPASLAFAISVIFTMLAALSFDSRLIYDGIADDIGARA